MGARGKRRRRADGSIAGKPKQVALGGGRYEELGAVLPATLAGSVEISRRYVPLDGRDVEDWDWEAEAEEMDAFAEREGVDAESLAVRAGKLIDLLRLPSGQELYRIDGDRVVIDRALLEHAATIPIDDSSAPLVWPVGGVERAAELRAAADG